MHISGMKEVTPSLTVVYPSNGISVLHQTPHVPVKFTNYKANQLDGWVTPSNKNGFIPLYNIPTTFDPPPDVLPWRLLQQLAFPSFPIYPQYGMITPWESPPTILGGNEIQSMQNGRSLERGLGNYYQNPSTKRINAERGLHRMRSAGYCPYQWRCSVCEWLEMQPFFGMETTSSQESIQVGDLLLHAELSSNKQATSKQNLLYC